MAAPIPNASDTPASGSYNSAGGKTTLVLLLVFAVFFLLAGVTNINDALVAKFKAMFQLSNFEANLVQFAFFMSYALFSIPSGLLLRKIGFIRGFILGFLIIAAASLLFIPAANSGVYLNFLGALFLIGGGITLLQVAMNPLVTTLGPPETSMAAVATGPSLLLDAGRTFVLVRGVRDGFVRELYAGGAWLVLPAMSGGCRSPARKGNARTASAVAAKR